MRHQRGFIYLCLAMLLSGRCVFATQSPDDLIELVRAQRIEDHIQRLVSNPVDGNPTHSRSTYRREVIEAAADYIADEFRKLPGMQVKYDDFSGLRNVVATLPGEDTSRVYVIGAHYDSKASREVDWNPLFSPAPGANDNASGVALMLETARVLSLRPHRYTLQFVAFDAEEAGLFGSRHYVSDAINSSQPIAGVFNVDMIGFNWWFPRVEVVSDPASAWLANYLWIASDWYKLGLEVTKNIDASVGDSDHRSFWEAGYRAVMLTEDGEPWQDSAHYVANPYYHTYLDTIDTVNMELIAKITQLVTAVVAELANQSTPLVAPVIKLLPPEQREHNPVMIRGRFESDLPVRIVIQPGDILATLSRESGLFSADLVMKGGRNRIQATAISPGGVYGDEMEIDFLPEFQFTEAYVYPNPADEFATFQCVGDRPMDQMKLQIHGPDGVLLRVIDGIGESSDFRTWRAWWNLKVSGIPVTNGVYPCVFEVKVGDELHHTGVTIAVER